MNDKHTERLENELAALKEHLFGNAKHHHGLLGDVNTRLTKLGCSADRQDGDIDGLSEDLERWCGPEMPTRMDRLERHQARVSWIVGIVVSAAIIAAVGMIIQAAIN